MKLACLGPKGTFTEQVAYIYNPEAEIICCRTIEDSMNALKTGEATESIVPMENSIEGTVNATLDYLIFEADFFVKKQVDMRITQNFLVKKDYNGEKIEAIFSHPQGLAQSRKFTNNNYQGVPSFPKYSTAEAARHVSMSSEHFAAIGTARTAEIYGLKILHENIQETENNITSFAVLTKEDTSVPKMLNKTSLVFSTQNKPGELYKILDIFSLWDLNMTKIVSRPMKTHPGEYVFLIDLEDYSNIQDVKDALTMVKRKSNFYKILGTYPVVRYPH